MRIIVNAISANTGGIVTYTSNLIRSLADRDLEAIIYVPQQFDLRPITSPNIKTIPVPVKRFHGPIHRFLWEQFVWRRIIKKSGADLLFSSANYGVLFPPVPQVLLVQGEIYLNPVYREKVLPHLSLTEKVSAFFRRNLMLYSARHSEFALFPSQVALEAALDYGPDVRARSKVNYLGVSSSFNLQKRKRSWGGRDGLKLLYVSVYYPHKDPVTLAEAARVLNQKGIPANAHITMEVHDFDPWPTCRHELDELLSDKFKERLKIGRIDHADLAKALDEFDVFVFPSMAETFGFPMVEAMRAGIPLVVSDIPVHREICGESALYFKLGDPEDLAARIQELDSDAVLRAQLIESGRRRATENFTWKNHIDSLHGLFRDALAVRPLRVLINALHARTGGGVTYLANMLPLLANDENVEVHLCAHEDQVDILPTHLEGVTYHFLKFKRGFWNVLYREQIDLPALARRIRTDVTFSPANYGPIFVRNAIIMVRNAVSVGFVERRPLKLAYWFLLYLATLLSLVTCRRAIAVSDYARRVGTGIFGPYFRKRISVVPHGVNRTFHYDPTVERDPNLILAVSDIYVQKNFRNLLMAISRLRSEFPELKVKIAGRPVDEDYFEILKDLVRSERLEDTVKFLGAVDVSALSDLYRKCGIFVFPSTVETFGNPLVEAMASGAPIACSNSTAMPEVLGDAGVYFDPHDVDDMRNVLADLMGDPLRRAEIAAKAAERSRQFSWTTTEQRTRDILDLRKELSAT